MRFPHIAVVYCLLLSSWRQVSGLLIFPTGAYEGMRLSLSLPIDQPEYNIHVSYFVKSQYLEVSNFTQLVLGSSARASRDVTRASLYSHLEKRLDSEGLKGRECLLRTICETSGMSLVGHSGLLGDLLHIIFTPSSTASENLLAKEFHTAETIGHAEASGSNNCEQHYPACDVSMYDWLS